MRVLVVPTLISLMARLTTGSAAYGEYHNELDPAEEGRASDWAIIFPGTKWCGAGNISNDVDDLGPAADTDRCCRAHDFCDDVIGAGETKHNLTNTAFYSRLNCKCDDEFYKCLKEVDSNTSRKVGYIYFSVLDTKCFREDYPVIRCKRYKKTLVRIYCAEYEFDMNGTKRYQWFDVPNF